MPLVANLSSKGSLSDVVRVFKIQIFLHRRVVITKTSGWHPDKNIRLGRMDGLVLLKINKYEEIVCCVLESILKD